MLKITSIIIDLAGVLLNLDIKRSQTNFAHQVVICNFDPSPEIFSLPKVKFSVVIPAKAGNLKLLCTGTPIATAF